MKFLVYLLVTLSLFAYSSSISKQQTPSKEEKNLFEEEFSHNTLIISVDPSASKEEIIQLFDEYHLEIVYDYTSFNMYAVKTEKDMSIAELNQLIEKLTQNEIILSAEKDRVIHLDDPIRERM